VTTEAWTYLFITITFSGYLYIGWRARVQESKGFFIAGQGVPPIANGAATAADWMSAASFISMAGLISFMGYDGAVYLLGWTGGYVLLALLLAPYLRKFGKYTVPDFVGDRYYSTTARVVAVIARSLCRDLCRRADARRRHRLQPFFRGARRSRRIHRHGGGRVFRGAGRDEGHHLDPGRAVHGADHRVPDPLDRDIGHVDRQSDSATRVDRQRHHGTAQPDSGRPRFHGIYATVPGQIDDRHLVHHLALMVGTAGLPHVIVRFYTVPNVRAARYSAGWALLFIAVLYTTAPALAVFARYNLINSLHGAEIVSVQQPDEGNGLRNAIVDLKKTTESGEALDLKWTEQWQATGLLAFDDKNGDGTIVMSADAAVSEIMIDRDIIVLATPEVAGLAPWVVALVAAGGLAAALSTAAGLLLVISSSIAHDIYYRLINPTADEAHRVAAGRIFVLAGIVIAGYFGIYPPGFVGEVVAFAFGFAAASFFPIILLGIFDSRTNREGAIAGMVSGLAFTAFYIVGTTADKIIPGVTEPFFGHWFFGISPQGIGAVGMVINLVVTLAVSRITPPPPQHVQELVDSLRLPDHAGPAQILDERHE
jgi:cation/acetate symporter